MDKGARVTIVRGRQGVGVSGEIFWKGPNKYGEGDRFGIRGDDGETYWISEEDVEPAAGPPPELEPGRAYEKGDRVAFSQGGRDGTGTVFWVGQSRHGPGQRLGVRDDAPEGEDDAVWIDARLVRPLEEGEVVPSAPAAPAAPAPAADPAPDEDWAAPAGPDDLPEPPPDDGYLDQWAGSVPDEDEAEGIPPDWQPGD